MRTVSLFFVVFAFACSKTETPPEAESTAPAAAPATPEPVPAEPLPPVGPAVVELVDAGQSPLQPVRWQFTKGSKNEVQMKTELALEAQVGDQNTPRAVTPAVQYRLSIQTREVSPDGTAEMKFEVTDAKVLEGSGAPTQMVTQLRRSVMSTKRSTGVYTVGASGAVQGVEIDKSKVEPGNLQAVDNVEQLVYWTTVPVPTEPIGLGAKWTVSRVIEEGGIRMKQLASYELTKIEGSSFHVDLEVRKTAPTQTVTAPGAAENESYELTHFDSTGKGTVEADLGKVVPVSSKLDSVVEMAMNTPGPQGRARTLKVVMETTATLNGN